MRDLVQANIPGGAMAVRRIAYGERIDRDGVYDIPMGHYHGDCCVGPSVSSTGLRKIYHYSPKHYWATSYLNPNRDEEKDEPESMPLRVGRAAHTLLLEPHLFRQLYTTRPGAFADWRTKAAKEWRASAQLDGFTVLEPSDMQRVHGVHKALQEHPLFAQGLLEGDIERALIWKDEKSGIWIKSRPDAIPAGSNIVADLKCTNDCRSDAIERKIYEMGYDIQLALVGIGMEKVLKREVEEFVLVMVEYESPYGVRIATIPDPEISRARSMARFALDRLRTCIDDGVWPSFDLDDTAYAYRSSFRAKMIDAEISSGRLPKEF